MAPARRLLRLSIRRRLAAALLFVAVAAAGCGNTGGTPTADGPVRVVATTTVLADLVRQVGGDRVSVTSLVPPGGEIHTFDPTPSDIASVADADLIAMNGLGLDAWLGTIAAASGGDAAVIELGTDLDGVEYLTEDDAVNPHLWLNVAYAMRYVERIGEALTDVAPEERTAFETATAAYLGRLETLHAWARDKLAAVPEADRRIVSVHEAFPYFAAAYGLEIVGTVVDAPGQDPSAGEIAALVEEVRTSGARAIFSEAQFSPELTETVAREAGVTVESNLYNDSLGDPPADTYEGMIRWDVERVVAALTR